MDDADDGAAAGVLERLERGCEGFPPGVPVGLVGADEADFDAVFFIDVGAVQVVVAAKPADTLIFQRLEGAVHPGRAVVQDVVVGNKGHFHAALEQDARKIFRRAEEVVLLGRGAGFVVEDIFQVDDGEVVFLKQVLHLGEGVGVAVLFDVADKGKIAGAQPLLPAQGAIPGEGEQDAAALGRGRLHPGGDWQAQDKNKGAGQQPAAPDARKA